jgi:hypothetical protein
MDVRWIGTGVAAAALGTNVALRMFPKIKPSTQQVIGRASIVLMVIGVGIIGYGFVVGGDRGAQKPLVSIEQTNPYQSPNVFGDNNQFTINPEVKSRRIEEKDKVSIAEELKATGSYPVRLTYLADVEYVYVSDWFDVLKRAEWPLDSNPRFVDFSQPEPGLLILVRDQSVPPWNPNFVPAGVSVLYEVFTRHEIQFTLQRSTNTDPNVIEIIVGRRS